MSDHRQVPSNRAIVIREKATGQKVSHKLLTGELRFVSEFWPPSTDMGITSWWANELLAPGPQSWKGMFALA